MKKSYKRFLVTSLAFVLMLSLVPAISFAASATSPETDDNSIKIESKAKTVKYKLTWNANGGKIGSKKTMTTTVKKGSKIGKLVTTPKRSSYTFKGWYTKKSGGTKINKNTKPKKSATLYAQWQKKTSSSSGSNSIVGSWSDAGSRYVYTFRADGTCMFLYRLSSMSGYTCKEGKYYTSGGRIYLTNLVDYYDKTSVNNRVWSYSFGTDEYGKYVMLKLFSFRNNVPDSTESFKFRR